MRATIVIADLVFGLVLLGIAVTGSLPVTSPAPTERPTDVQLVDQFAGLMPAGQSTGFAVANDGTLAIVDRGRNTVLRLDASGHVQAEWGPSFGHNLDSIDLVGITQDGDGWDVLDRGALRILHLDAEGHAQPDRAIDLSKLQTYGPNGLARDRQGNLYLADTGRDRLVIFSSSGAMSATIGDAGTDLGKFKQPMFLAFGPDGSFYVSDWENSRIERFDASRNATNAWPLPVHAWGIAVDGLGRIYAPDGDHHVVRMFGPDGSLLAQISADPLAGVSQVGVSPDDAWLWTLGSDGLARVDLAPFADLKSGAQTNRTPLAVLGALLLLLAAVVVVVRPSPRPVRVRAPARAPQPPPLQPRPGEPIPRPSPPMLAGALLALGGAGASLAEVSLLSDAAKADPWPRMAALALASLVFAAGAARTRPWRWVREACAESVCPERVSLPTLAVTAAIVVLAGVAGGVWWLGTFETPAATRAVFIWLAALVLTAGALLSDQRPKRPTLWTLVPWLLFAVALVPRAWDNANLPVGVWFDEAEAGLQARKFLQNGLYTPMTNTYGRDASLFYYGISAAQAVIADPVLAGRLVAAIVGAACAPLLYFLGRELFGWPVGLAAGAIIATQRWHLDVSRLGWDPISVAFFAILAFWLVARAIRTGRSRDAIWAGMAFGLGLHGYIGFRVLPIVGLILLLYAGWRRRWPPLRYAGRVGLTLAAAALTALPVAIFAIHDPAGFNGRFAQTLVLVEPVSQSQKLDELWSNLQKHALMFHVSGDMNGRHNLPGAPMLDPLSGLLLMLGLATCVVRPFDWRSWLVFGWGASSMAGGIFTIPYEAPQAMRTLGVTPLLALLVGLGLVLALDRAAAYVRTRDHFVVAAGTGVALFAAAYIGFTNLTTFFVRQMNDPTVWDSFSTRETLPSRAAQAAAQPYEAILGSQTIAPSKQQQLLVPTIQNTICTFNLTTDLPYRGDGPALIVLESEHDTGLADAVSRYYPDAQRTPIVPPNGTRPTADELLLDSSVITAHRGLAASRRPDGSVRADLLVDVPGAYAFRVPPGSSLSLDATSVRDGQSVQLVPGNHLLVASGISTLEWRPPGASDFAPVEDRRLFAAPEGGNGLLATFYPTQDFEGSPTESIIDPVLAHYYHLSPFGRLNLSPPMWSAEWLGSLDVPATGVYRFDADRLSRAGLWIDDVLVFDDTAAASSQAQAGTLQLTAGRHAIRVRMQNRGDGSPRLYLYWTPPGSVRTLVSGAALHPPPPQ